MYIRIIFTFVVKVLLSWRTLLKILHLVQTAGGDFKYVGLEGFGLEMNVWVDFPSLLEVQWSKERGYVLDTVGKKGVIPDEAEIHEQVRYLLKGVPKDQVVCQDLIVGRVVAKVYGDVES